jgi:mycothiol synthase
MMTDQMSTKYGIDVKLPEIKGLVFRSFQGKSDYPNILAVIEGSKSVDQMERSDTLEEVALSYAHLTNSDPYSDMLFAEVNGKVVGYCRVWWDLAADGNWLGSHLAFLLPDWRRKGIGSVLLNFCENRLRVISEQQIGSGSLTADAPRLYSVFISQHEKDREALLEVEGYRPVRYAFDMVRPDLEDIPEAELPAGLEVRPVLPEHYRPIWDASNEAFRDHWSYTPESEKSYQKMISAPDFDPSIWLVAWDGDQVAGMVLNFINKKENQEYNRLRGYTENICVRRPWRKRGLASALILRSQKLLHELGMKEAALGVDAENLTGALGLYERLGYKVVNRWTVYRKPIV